MIDNNNQIIPKKITKNDTVLKFLYNLDSLEAVHKLHKYIGDYINMHPDFPDEYSEIEYFCGIVFHSNIGNIIEEMAILLDKYEYFTSSEDRDNWIERVCKLFPWRR